VPHVLATLERTHDPERIPLVVEWARAAGLQVSLDLIYGTPGESLADWQRSLELAIDQDPDHISAYSLIVEPGTKLARQIAKGEVPEPDEDLQAEQYELADELLATAGYGWYEVSNWSRDASHRSRHNLAYWTGQDWWGAGPGAHSHIGGVRWWNVKHPAAYAERIAAGVSPAAGRETLDEPTRRTENVLLGIRISDGLALDALEPDARRVVAELIAEGLVDGRAALGGRLVLTLRGRLLADGVVRRLLP
jgi:coproporphyrinogen III oxidase-like Fe-S oxidoreductase